MNLVQMNLKKTIGFIAANRVDELNLNIESIVDESGELDSKASEIATIIEDAYSGLEIDYDATVASITSYLGNGYLPVFQASIIWR